jgi:2-iminobutanoate/2-iminopropanoate deaminase
MKLRLKRLLSSLVVFALAACATAPAKPIERIFVNPWEKNTGYAQIIRRGDHFYISGMNHDGPDVEAQMRGIYTDFFAMMKPYGATSRNVVREVVYTTDIEALKKANPVRKSFFPDETYPTSSWIQIDRLFSASDLVEIEFEVILD